MSDKPASDPPRKAHNANELGGERPAFYAAADALDNLDTDLSDHAGATGDVHGVSDTDTVAGQSDVDAVATDLSNHSGSSSGVHGVGTSNVESESGAQSKADSAESSANNYTDTHENKNNPHSSSLSTSYSAPVQSVDGKDGNVTVSHPASTQNKKLSGGFSTFEFAENDPDTSHTNVAGGSELVDDTNAVQALSQGNEYFGWSIGGEQSRVIDAVRMRGAAISGADIYRDHINSDQLVGSFSSSIETITETVNFEPTEFNERLIIVPGYNLTIEYVDRNTITLPNHDHQI